MYINSKSQGGKTLDQGRFGFKSSGDVHGGAPRFSLPIDDPATPTKGDGHAFIDAAGCGAVVGDSANVATTVSTENEACHVQYKDGYYANWDAFAAANPTLITTPGAIPFIIADWTPRTRSEPSTSATSFSASSERSSTKTCEDCGGRCGGPHTHVGR